MTQLYPQYKKQLTTKIVLFSALSLLMMASLPNTYAEQYPDVPVPFKNGTGGKVENSLYVGLGSAGVSWFRLDTDKTGAGWQKVANFPGQPREQAVTVVLAGKLYVFGGVGKRTPTIPKYGHWMMRIVLIHKLINGSNWLPALPEVWWGPWPRHWTAPRRCC